jgi:hypothetical protein
MEFVLEEGESDSSIALAQEKPCRLPDGEFFPDQTCRPQ